MAINWDQYEVKEKESPSFDWDKYSVEEKNLNPNVMKRIPGALGNVAKDVGNLAIGLPVAAIQGAMNLPSNVMNFAQQLPGTGSQIINEPGRASRNAIAGLADIGHGALNAPRSIADYLSKIGMIESGTAQKVPMQPDISKELSQFVGEGNHPGDELLRGIVRNIPTIVPSIKAAQILNPAKLSYKNLAQKIVDTEKSMKEKYSGENGLYNKLSKEAQSRGLTQANINASKIDLDTIKKYTAEKNYASLDEFLKDKNLTNAQKAISDLGHVERRLDNKLTLNSEERAQLKAVKDAKNHIQENMFKDNQGNIHHDLLETHKKIQQGYAKEVIPYTKNAAIQKFKKGEKLPKELIQSLSKGKFAAQRGSNHKMIKLRNFINEITGSKFSQGALLGAGGLGAIEALKSLSGGND